MERNGYVDFALPDKMFTEVSVNPRQIGSQELHMIFALGCFSLLQKQFILIKQSFILDHQNAVGHVHHDIMKSWYIIILVS